MPKQKWKKQTAGGAAVEAEPASMIESGGAEEQDQEEQEGQEQQQWQQAQLDGCAAEVAHTGQEEGDTDTGDEGEDGAEVPVVDSTDPVAVPPEFICPISCEVCQRGMAFPAPADLRLPCVGTPSIVYRLHVGTW
jgi:hypothetical protein